MNISTLIPQLFYDLIGRLVPGATLLGLAFLLFGGPVKGLQYFSTWSGSPTEANVPTGLVLFGNLLVSYVLATLLGGIWFITSSKCLARRGEIHLTEAFKHRPLPNQFSNRSSPEALYNEEVKKVSEIDFNHRITLMYDYVQLRCPKASARIVKLRAEQHMSGVLAVGFFALGVLYFIATFVKNFEWSLWIVEPVLIIAALTSARLAFFLERRGLTALYNYWFLVWYGIVKGEGPQEPVGIKE